MDGFEELKSAVDSVKLIDAHPHNIVASDSAHSFFHCFSEAAGEPHSISFKRSLREIAELYGVESSLEAVQDYRSRFGVESVTSRCLKAAGISGILIDDGIDLNKSYEIDWHEQFVPFVGRVLRIEGVAEKILDEGIARGVTGHWTHLQNCSWIT